MYKRQPLQRAKETALLVLGERDIPVITDARIQEIGFGTYEGRRVRDAKGEITDPKFFAFFRDVYKRQTMLMSRLTAGNFAMPAYFRSKVASSVTVGISSTAI